MIISSFEYKKLVFERGKKSDFWLDQDLNRDRLGERPMTNPHNHGTVVNFFQTYFVARQSLLESFSCQIGVSLFTKVRNAKEKLGNRATDMKIQD